MRIICIMIFTYIVSFKIISMKRGIVRFVSMLFKIFKKVYEQKNCPRYFQIRKSAFSCDYFLV